MEYQVLARKFRPQSFEEIVGQQHIRLILQNAIIQNKIAHAYLFSGTRGVGKTTAARIFAKAIMCANRDSSGNPCQTCESCVQVNRGSSLDYLEIDGASNNSVENIRELIENVQYLPTNGKYKVYVIDEVHMLSSSAFNALLKTLEEPPAHVVFIFATTDPHKLLDTVISRCQRVEFKNLSHDELKSLIMSVAKKDEIQFESDEVIDSLCEHGNGSGRDVLSVLELLKNITTDKKITLETLSNVLGIPEKSFVVNFLNSMFMEDIDKVNQMYVQAVDGPIDLAKFHLYLQKNLFELVEQVSLGKPTASELEGVSKAELYWIYEVMGKDFGWIENSSMIEQNLKLLYFKLTLRRQILNAQTTADISVKKKEIIEEPLEKKEDPIADVLEQMDQEDSGVAAELAEPEETEELEESFEEEELPRSSDFYFQDFIEDLYEKNSTLAMNLERGNLLEEAFIIDGRLSLTIGFSEDEKLFFDVVSEPESRKKLLEIINETYEVLEDGVSIQFKLLDESEKDSKNFRSKVEVDEDQHKLEKHEQKERLMNNAYIKSAEEIFESKVNKIILND